MLLLILELQLPLQPPTILRLIVLLSLLQRFSSSLIPPIQRHALILHYGELLPHFSSIAPLSISQQPLLSAVESYALFWLILLVQVSPFRQQHTLFIQVSFFLLSPFRPSWSESLVAFLLYTLGHPAWWFVLASDVLVRSCFRIW